MTLAVCPSSSLCDGICVFTGWNQTYTLVALNISNISLFLSLIYFVIIVIIQDFLAPLPKLIKEISVQYGLEIKSLFFLSALPTFISSDSFPLLLNAELKSTFKITGKNLQEETNHSFSICHFEWLCITRKCLLITETKELYMKSTNQERAWLLFIREPGWWYCSPSEVPAVAVIMWCAECELLGLSHRSRHWSLVMKLSSAVRWRGVPECLH